jgi:hypothetical protein
MAAAAFWIFLAAVIVAAEWRKKHVEAMRHETMRLLIEKNKDLDEEQLKALLGGSHPIPSYFWAMQAQHLKSKRGDAYKGLRASGSIIMLIALGLLIAAVWVGSIRGINDEAVLGIGIAVPIVALVGAGLFFASRYAAKPPSGENRDPQDL